MNEVRSIQRIANPKQIRIEKMGEAEAKERKFVK